MLIINLVTILCPIIWYFMRFFDLFSKKIQKWQKTVFSQKPCLHPYSITLLKQLQNLIISKIRTIHPEPLTTIDFGQKSIRHTSRSSFSRVVCRKNKQTNKFSQKLITATKQAQFLFHLNCHNNKNNSPNK